MLPQKVREQAERAERLHAEAYGNTAQTAAPEVAHAPEVVPLNAEPPALEMLEAPPVQPQAPATNWEEKYRVLNGKYQAEVPRMASEIRDLKGSLQELQHKLTAPPAQPPAAPVDTKGMTPADVVEQFGEDFAKAVGAIASQYAQRSASEVRDEFRPHIERVEKTASESARDAYMRELERLVPDWKAIDTDDNFTTFLDEGDEMSGRTRRFFFQEADKAMNAARVARFFHAFKGNSTPAPVVPAVPAAPSAIDVMVQPSAVRVSQPPQGRRMWTSRDIGQFYVDQRRGRFTPADAKRIESDIFAAQREGRIAA